MTDVLIVNASAPDPACIERAAERLRAGGLVAFPTETVYGLGAHALDGDAVRRIFAAKGRPATDPLIVHISAFEDLGPLVTRLPPAAEALARRFWPGPLTLVLQRSRRVPLDVTAGGETVGVRVPAHPVAQALLRAAGIPVAAPSANLFSRPSPTRADHVLHDLDGRIDLLLDGGATDIGVESTVLDLTASTPVVLRPGAVTLEMLRPFVPDVVLAHARGHSLDGPARSPGMLDRHYSPQAPLTLYEGPQREVIERMLLDAREILEGGQHVGVLVPDEAAAAFEASGLTVARMGSSHDLAAIAVRLYAALRELDGAGVDVILASSVAYNDGLGGAIKDRLRRAAGRIVAT